MTGLTSLEVLAANLVTLAPAGDVLPGTWLWTAGEDASSLWSATEGLFWICAPQPCGQEVSIGMVVAPAILGVEEALLGIPRATACIALERGRVARVPTRAIGLDAGLRNQLWMAATDQAFNHLLDLAARIHQPLQQRVARVVETFSRLGHHGSHREIAEIAGCQRENASRVLTRMKRAAQAAPEAGALTTWRDEIIRLEVC